MKTMIKCDGCGFFMTEEYYEDLPECPKCNGHYVTVIKNLIEIDCSKCNKINYVEKTKVDFILCFECGEQIFYKICKNCKHWIEEKESGPHGVKVGLCEKYMDTPTMEETEISINCGHDGPIYFGCKFGCNRWEKK